LPEYCFSVVQYWRFPVFAEIILFCQNRFSILSRILCFEKSYLSKHPDLFRFSYSHPLIHSIYSILLNRIPVFIADYAYFPGYIALVWPEMTFYPEKISFQALLLLIADALFVLQAYY